MTWDQDNYVDVPERITIFRTKYPDGSLQADVIKWPAEGFPGLVVKAYAYRSPDDERPGVGHAFEPVPGKTNFTRDSEVQNAETSAWGRAIVAALAADTKRGIASREEVAARQASGTGVEHGEGSRQPEDAAGPAEGSALLPIHVETIEDLSDLWTEALKVGLTERKALAVATTRGLGVKSAAELDVPQMREVLTHWLTMKAKR